MNDIFIKIDSDSWLRRIFQDTDYVSIEDLLGKIEDQDDEIFSLKEKIEDLENDIRENYELKNIDQYDYYGVDKKDFM